jgi:hypothetical protein
MFSPRAQLQEARRCPSIHRGLEGIRLVRGIEQDRSEQTCSGKVLLDRLDSRIAGEQLGRTSEHSNLMFHNFDPLEHAITRFSRGDQIHVLDLGWDFETMRMLLLRRALANFVRRAIIKVEERFGLLHQRRRAVLWKSSFSMRQEELHKGKK